MQNFGLGDLRQLFVGHRHVGGAEIHGAFGELADSAARTDGLVVDLDVGMRLVIFLKPLLINRRGERGPRRVDGFGRCRNCGGRGEQR